MLHPSHGPRAHRPRLRDAACLIFLTAAMVAIGGFHPFADDGGLYAAAIQLRLTPALFPHDRAFVAAHAGAGLLPPLIALLVRAGVPLMGALCAVYIAGAMLFVWAARQLAAAIGITPGAAWIAAAVAAVSATVPVGGTSLLLFDPYTTSRTLSTPLGLLALAFAVRAAFPIEVQAQRQLPAHIRDVTLCAASLLAAAAFHPLMAGYAALPCALVAALSLPRRAQRALAGVAICGVSVLLCVAVQTHAAAESVAYALAVRSRYYWFLGGMQWYELVGFIAPCALFALMARYAPQRAARRLACACLAAGVLAVALSLGFCRVALAHHAVARLQPLRTYVLLYAAMLVLLPVVLAPWLTRRLQTHTLRAGTLRSTATSVLLALALIAIAVLCGTVQHARFARSAWIELDCDHPRNPWAQAFVWLRQHTPATARVAIDARYIDAGDDEAQSLRAWSERGSVPDWSKDGGEASLEPQLAEAWLAGATAQSDLNALPPAELAARLRPWQPAFVVLRATAPGERDCPYSNAVVKLCRLTW